MTKPYRIGLRPGPPDRGGAAYRDMARALLDVVVRGAPTAGGHKDEDKDENDDADEREPIDLLVLSYAIPDIDPGRSITARLSHACPGRPLAFAISDQGAGAPFTGLRLIGEYARTGQIRRAVLIVLEQASLPYDVGVPMEIPDTHRGVALVFGAVCEPAAATGGGHDRPRLLGTVAVQPRCAAAGLDGRISALSQDGTVILSAGFAARNPGAAQHARVAQPGRPHTGVWWELAGEQSGPAAVDATGGSIILADYDPARAEFCLARFDPVGTM